MELFYSVVILTALSGTHAHTFHYGYNYDAFIDDAADMYSVRECTICADDYPTCPTDYRELLRDYYDTNRWWRRHLQYSSAIYLTCWHDEVPENGDRKKRATIPLHADKQELGALSNRRKRSDHYDDHFDDNAEGLIYINRMFFGTKEYGLECDDKNLETDKCHSNGFNHWFMEHFVDCNGLYDCEDAAIPTFINDYNVWSDFLHIDYQCIQEKFIYKMEHEENTDDHTVREKNHYGYIMSPNYPHNYWNHEAVKCVLELDSGRGSVEFTALDFHLEERSHNHGCIYDWVEIQSYVNDDMADRQRYCGEYDPGSMTTASGDYFEIKFRTDRNVRDRGFWIKFQGYDATGNEDDVKVDCHYYDPSEDDFYDNMDPDYWNYYWDYDYSTPSWWTWTMPTKAFETTQRPFYSGEVTGDYDSDERDGGDDDSGEDDDDDDDTAGETDRQSSSGGDGGLDSQTIVIIAASAGGAVVLLIVIVLSVVCCRSRRSAAPPKKPVGLEAQIAKDAKQKPGANRKSENPYAVPAYSPQPQQGIYTMPFDNPGYQSHPSDQKLSIRTGPLPSAPSPESTEEVYEAIADSGLYQELGNAVSNHGNAVHNPGYDNEVPIRTVQNSGGAKPALGSPPSYSETYEDVTSVNKAKYDNTKPVTSSKPVQRMPTYQNTNENSYDVLRDAVGVHTNGQRVQLPSEHPYLSVHDGSSNYYLEPVS